MINGILFNMDCILLVSEDLTAEAAFLILKNGIQGSV